jgi:hypothetical protein
MNTQNTNSKMEVMIEKAFGSEILKMILFMSFIPGIYVVGKFVTSLLQAAA